MSADRSGHQVSDHRRCSTADSIPAPRSSLLAAPPATNSAREDPSYFVTAEILRIARRLPGCSLVATPELLCLSSLCRERKRQPLIFALLRMRNLRGMGSHFSAKG